MSEGPPLFSEATKEKRRITPAMIGIVAGSVALVCLLIGGAVLIQRMAAPKYKEGRTVFSGVVRADNPHFKDYLPFLKIVNASGQVSENLLGGQQAVVAGEVLNRGGRVVEIVEVRATLYGADDRPIREFIKTPIQPASPLLPQEIRKFSVWVEPFPPEWLTGRVEVEILGYRLAK